MGWLKWLQRKPLCIVCEEEATRPVPGDERRRPKLRLCSLCYWLTKSIARTREELDVPWVP